MKRVGLIGLLGASLAAAIASASLAFASRRDDATCAGSQWQLTTLSDPDRGKVMLSPRATTIGAINARRTPHPLPTRRTTAFQKQNWQVIAQIAEYRLVGRALHLTLYDDNAYVDAAVPVPSCLPRTARARTAIMRAWTQFTSDCGHPTEHAQTLGAVAYVTGVGFWSNEHAGHGLAPNGAALRPVTGFRFVAGCGS